MMQQLKLCAFVLVLLISGNGFSFIHVCGNHTGTDGVTTVLCFSFSGKCDDEKNLAGLGELFPGGWTCAMPGIASQETGGVHLIAEKDGGATVVVGGVRTPVGSDDFLEFVNRLQRENQGLRVNTQVLQGQFDAFLDTDNGVVSNARLKELSRELGVPIEREGSLRPGVQPGTGRGTSMAAPGSNPVDTTAVQKDGATTSGARRPDHCSLPDCSCRVVSPSGDSLCEGGTEEETTAGVHYCKCGKFGAPSLQSGGAGGDFTVDNTGAVGWSEPADDAVVSVASPKNPNAQPAPPAPAARQRAQRGPATAPEQQAVGSGDTCTAEYETAGGVEVFFREDRRVTGIWTAKPGPRTPFQKPGLIVADANGCLYGCTGNVWEPLDCPGGDFSSPRSYPGEFTMGASCSSTSTSGLRWHRVNEGRDGATKAPTREVPGNRFALSHPTTRPPEGQGEGPGTTTRQVYCWVEENEIAWWLRCCEYDFEFEVLPIDPGPGVSLMNEPDTVLCAPNSGMEMPDVQDGSIVLRTSGGKDYCMSPDGSFGACAAEFDSRGKGTR